MPDQVTSSQPSLDLSRIEDPDVRRVLRALQAEYSGKLAQMELAMEAILELLLEKHIGSVGEFRRLVVKLQQNHGKANRLHELISGTGAPAHGVAAASGSTPLLRSIH